MSDQHIYDVPSPRPLSDEDLAAAGVAIERLCRDLIGIPEGVVTGTQVNALEPAARWLYRWLYAGHRLLKDEDDRRTDTEAAALVAQLEAFLEEQR